MIPLRKDDCSACGACVQICPQRCIELVLDSSGFAYPKITVAQCIDCGLCHKVCHCETPYSSEDSERQYYAAKNRNLSERLASSSGGIFTILAQKTIQNGGVVFGAGWNEHWRLVIQHTDKVGDLSRLYGSKYLEAETGNSFSEVKKFLNDGRPVLFTSTPCRVSALKHYLQRPYENLLTIDFICHSIPSAALFDQYLTELLEKTGCSRQNISAIYFRKKGGNYSWSQSGVQIEVKKTESASGSQLICDEPFNQNTFMRAFSSDLSCRPVCQICHEKNYCSKSDITLGDFWGIQKFHPEFFDSTGVSFVSVNSAGGRKIWEDVQKKVITCSVTLPEILDQNPALRKRSLAHPHRAQFWHYLKEGNGFDSAVLRYAKPTVKQKIYSQCICFLQKMHLLPLMKRILRRGYP